MALAALQDSLEATAREMLPSWSAWQILQVCSCFPVAIVSQGTIQEWLAALKQLSHNFEHWKCNHLVEAYLQNKPLYGLLSMCYAGYYTCDYTLLLTCCWEPVWPDTYMPCRGACCVFDKINHCHKSAV